MALVNKPDESIFASSAKQGEVDNFPDLLRGWGISFEQTGGIPPMEWFNFLFKRLDEKHTYLMQRGLPEWSATQDYTKGSCVQFDGVSYRALKNSKNNIPNGSDSQYWVRWGFTLGEIARATLTQYGVTQLYTGYDSQSEDLALTPKTAYQLKQLIDSNTRSLGNFIPNSKKSSAVNSNSAETVATSAAVKTAYDKGVEAKTAADNANSNANGRVSKSGDTMTGTLTIENNEPRVHGKNAGTHKWFIGLPNANTDYPRFHSYANDTWMELNSGNIIVNKPLYLGNNPLPSSLNGHHVQFRWNNTALELKVDNSELGYLHTSIKAYVETNVVDNNYSGLNIIRKGTSGNFWARFEALPDRRWKFSTENGSTIHLKNQSGNILLDSDISHSTNGTNKAKVASEFAVGELARSFSYQKIGNFEVRKYPDGTMIQTYFVDFYDVHGPNSGIGGTGQKQLTWAVSFSGKPLVWGNITSSLEDSHDIGVNILTKSTGTTLYWYNYEHSNQNQGACRLQFLAVGRWK